MVLKNYKETITAEDLEKRLEGWYAAYSGKSNDDKPLAYFRTEEHAKIFLLTYGKGKSVQKLFYERGDEYGRRKNV